MQYTSPCACFNHFKPVSAVLAFTEYRSYYDECDDRETEDG